jgi:hypothetical protein
MKTIAVIAVVAGLAGVAQAGNKSGMIPTVVSYNAGTLQSGGYAGGQVGDARASADIYQAIGCTVTYGSGFSGPQATCSATDASGNFAFCASTNAGFVAAVQAMTSNSYIYFTWAANTYACTYIEVNNSSTHLPLQP